MKSDEELRKTFKIFVDEKEGIIWGTLLEESKELTDNTRQIKLIEEATLEIFNNNPQKEYKVLLKILPTGKGKIYTSSENRKAWARLASHKQVKKAAIVGSSVILKVVVNFIIRLSGKGKDIKWFFDQREATKWLKED